MKRAAILAFKFLIGILLIPLCWVATLVFFKQAASQGEVWQSKSFLWFFGGVVLWLLSFWKGPRLTRTYVFAHEFTHALTVWLCGGKVSDFYVGKSGGHVHTNMNNVWISLSPYFFPLYAIAVVLIFGAANWFLDLSGREHWFFGLLGLTMAHHWTFTVWALRHEQPDLQEHGKFFSLLFIYLFNVVVLCALGIVISPELTWADFGQTFDEQWAGFIRFF